jgi:hypothetical protein
MAIGPTPNLGQFQQQTQSAVLNARAALQQILFLNQYIQSEGVAGLVAIGYGSDDAESLMTVFGDLAAIAAACMGEPYEGPALPFDFLAQTVPLWNGQ